MRTRIVFISSLLFLLSACGAGDGGNGSGSGAMGTPSGSVNGPQTPRFFAADDGVHGTELWKTDGTSAGTVMVKDINMDGASSYPAGFTELNGAVYFQATDGVTGVELWKTDGTAEGTVLVKDINTGGVQSGAGSGPQGFTLYKGELYFTANNGVRANGYELWKTDGTAAGTVMVKDVNIYGGFGFPSNFIVFNDTLYFSADDGRNGAELWKSDGTAEGTTLLKDINTTGMNASSTPRDFVIFNGALYFEADSLRTSPAPSGQAELWRTDGTSDGTVLVKTISSSVDGHETDLHNFTVFNGELYFSASQGSSGYQPWKTDGTTEGTVVLKDLRALYETREPSVAFMPFNGELYFSAYDGAYGNELMKTNGTESGTVLVKDINPTAETASSSQGSSFPAQFIVFNDALYFQANDGVQGTELWKTDGTAVGTILLKDIKTAGASSNPAKFSIVNGVLYFKADDGVNGLELWKTDGTTNGTQLLKDICPGACAGVAN